jgi:TonB-linked SusC/RagA family outer membrane protein
MRSKYFVRLLPALALALAVSAGDAVAQAGSVTGRVTNAFTGLPIQGARLVVQGTNIQATTNEDGRYTLVNVSVGSRVIRVNYIGFTQQNTAVTVLAGSSASVDFALNASAIRLSEIVVSAVTGREKRSRELGVNIASIDVTEMEPAAVTSVSDILSARTAGVVLMDVNGTSGSAQRIRIRGANSLSLSNEPLVYIDGVLSNVDNGMSQGVGGQEASRLNDINPNDIENIEVVKGPAAAALYGTAAANGVLLITTKRGRPGAPEWNAYFELGELEDRTAYPTNYLSYEVIGSAGAPFFDPDGSFNSTDYARCPNRSAAAGTCTQDGMTTFNTLTDPRTTPYSKGDRRRYGLSVRGGGEQVTYFLSTELENETGVIDYNKREKVNVRANMNAAIRPDLDVSISSSYASVQNAFNSNDNSIFSALIGGLLGEGYFIPQSTKDADALPGVARSNYGFGFNSWDKANYVVHDNVDRLSIGGTAQYRPLSWLALNTQGGLDLISGHTFRTVQPGLLPIAASWENGFRESDRKTDYTYTFNATMITTFEPITDIVSTTTLGGTYTGEKTERTECYGSSLVQGTSSCGTTAALFSIDEDFSEIRTVGGYISTEIAWRDKVFLSGAIRGDDNSAFGTDFGFVTYPSAMASWVIGEEDWFPQTSFLSALRLRAAWGTSGLRPGFRDAVTLFSPTTVAFGGGDVPGIEVDATGNLELKPEKSTEIELGLDVALFDDRVGIDFTYFDKRSRDALISRRLPPSLGVAASRFENLGEVKNAGTETSVNIMAIDSRDFGLDLYGALTTLSNEVVDIGEGVEDIVFNRGLQRHREGFSAGGFFQAPVSWDDADGNGLLENSEVTIGDSVEFIGPALPTWQVSWGAGLRVSRWLTVSTLFEGRGGNFQGNDSEAFRCGFRSSRGCRAVGDPSAPLEDQAAHIADRYIGSAAGFVESADFVKWRELSVTLRAPSQLAGSMRALDGLSLTLAGRNLATWTSYPGLDPETVEGGGSVNFSQSEFNTQPPVRHLIIRLNYTF